MTPETFLLLLWLQLCAQHYGVEPEFVKAVADVECNVTQGFKTGAIDKKGKYIAPMGIHKAFRSKYDIDDPYTNIAIGTKALRGKNKQKVLRDYNRSYTVAYGKAVMKRYHFYKRNGLR